MSVINRKPVARRSNGLTGRANTSEKQGVALKAGNATLRLEDFVIVADKYEYPVEDRVPAGQYFSELKKLVPRIKDGKEMLDAFYEIRHPRGQSVYHIKQTYTKGSTFIQEFYNAMIAAGVKPGPNLKDAVGIEEFISLAYVSATSDFGSIVKRYPKAVALAYYGHSDEEADVDEEDDEDDDEDDEFDTFLSDLDED